MLDGFQNADGGVQLEVGTIQKFLIALKRYHTTAYLHIVCAQLRQFFRQDGLQTHKGLGDDFKLLCHYVYVLNMVQRYE